jgi:hypothetical protein
MQKDEYFWKTNVDCSIEQVQKCMHTYTLFNYAENYKMGYETYIAFFHCNDNKITKASAKYKLYTRVSDPNRHWCSLMAPTNVPLQANKKKFIYYTVRQ